LLGSGAPSRQKGLPATSQDNVSSDAASPPRGAVEFNAPERQFHAPVRGNDDMARRDHLPRGISRPAQPPQRRSPQFAHTGRRGSTCRVQLSTRRSHSPAKASRSPPPGRCLPGTNPTGPVSRSFREGRSRDASTAHDGLPANDCANSGAPTNGRLKKKTTQGEEEVVTIERHRIRPVSLTQGHAGEHLCRAGFNAVPLELLEALTGSEDAERFESHVTDCAPLGSRLVHFRGDRPLSGGE
jgi:hypothetical protein